jgi:hypothetical protein
MSTTYHGVTSALIIAPGEQITTANSGLTTLTRTYQCAATYEATAESILVPGYAPADYPLLALQTAPVAQRTGSITTFACTFFGVLSESAWERYYDQYSSRNEQASYTYEDFKGIRSLGFLLTSATGKFNYGAPVLSRSYVVPRATMPKVPALAASAWSGVPVSTFNEVPPASTVPTTVTLSSGDTVAYPVTFDPDQPRGSDLLAVGMTTRVNSFSVVPYGAANLVSIDYERVWGADGHTLNPYAHDPTNLRDSSIDALVLPTNNCTISGLTVTPEAYDSSDTLQASLGAGPISVGYASLSNPTPEFPVLATGIVWHDHFNSLSGNDYNGSTSLASGMLSTALHLKPWKYDIAVSVATEGGTASSFVYNVVTKGVPPPPTITSGSSTLTPAVGGSFPHAAYTTFRVDFDEAYLGATADFSITSYSYRAAQGGSTLTAGSPSISGPSDINKHLTFTLAGNVGTDVTLRAVNASGSSAVATTTIAI